MEFLLLALLGAVGVYVYTHQGSSSDGSVGGGGSGSSLPPYVQLTNWAGATVQHVAKDGAGSQENASIKRSTNYYINAGGAMTDDGKLAITGTYSPTPAASDTTIASVAIAQLNSLGADTHSIVLSLKDIAALLDSTKPAPATLTIFVVPNLDVPKLASEGSGFAVVD